MKLKQRIKKSIFAFFKDEILNEVGYNNPIQNIQFVSRELKFTELRGEILLNERDNYGEPISHIYEKALEKLKKELFEESMKYVQVDEKSVLDPHIYNHRAIRVSLFVGQKES